ncbi:hypothetical protein LEMLEM_LOCUS10706 [Lemmus lemmus]
MRKLFLGVAWKPEVPTKTNRLQRKASHCLEVWHLFCVSSKGAEAPSCLCLAQWVLRTCTGQYSA